MSDLRKILIIRFSSIGDIVLTSPIIRSLRTQFPDAAIHYVTKATYQPLLHANPHIDRVHTLSTTLFALIQELRKEQFSAVIDLHNNLRSHIITTALGRPYSRFPKMNREKYKLVRSHGSTPAIPHVVERYYAAGQKWDLQPDGKGLEHFVPAQEQVNSGILPAKYIAAGIGGTYPTKVFPTEQWLALIPRLTAPVVLLGGPQDLDMAMALQKAFPDQVLHNIGTWSVNQSASVLAQSAAVISNDTGMMHLAAAFRKPLAVTWGNTVPAFGMGPYYGQESPPPTQHFQVEGLDCRPCHKLGHKACPEHHFKCMRNQDVQDIARFVNHCLAKKSSV